MGLPRFNSCCCGCTLRMGCLILGWLGTVGSLLEIGGSILILSTPADELPKTPDLDLKARTGVTLIMAVVGLFFNLILLVGTYKESATHLRISVIYGLITYILGLLGTLVQIAVLMQAEQRVGGVIGFIIGALIGGYLWLIIRSHWLDLKEGKTRSSGGYAA